MVVLKVHVFWDGVPLSLYERICIRSFVLRGAEVNFFTFTQGASAPKGVRLRNAAEFATVEESRLFTQEGQKASLTAFSNLFRYRVLAEEGGWWMDSDVFCLKDAEAFDALERRSPGLVAARESPLRINNAVINISDPALAKALGARVWDVAEKRKFTFRWGAIGPVLLTAFVDDNPQHCAILPRDAFYPIHYQEVMRFFRSDQREQCLTLTQNALVVHLWNEILKQIAVPKNVFPPQGSYLFDLFASVESPSSNPQ